MLRKLKPKSEFSRNVVTLMTGTTIAQAVPIAISPLLTRLYMPEDFGVFALFIAVVGVLSILASGRYEMAILLPKKEDNARQIFILSFLINFMFSIFLLIVIILIHNMLLQYVRDEAMRIWLYFLPFAVFLVALYNQLNMYNNRFKYYKTMAQVSVIKSLVLSGVQIGLGLLKAGASGLISAQIVAQMSANIKLAKDISVMPGVLNISRVKLYAVAKKYNDFPKYNLPHALLSTLSANLPVYLFTPFFGSAVVGYYSFSLMIVFAPLMIVAGATAKVYNQQLTMRYRQGEETYQYTKKMLHSLAIKIAPVFVIILFFAPALFGFVFGNDWREAGIFTQILSPFLFLNILVSTVAFIPNLVGEQKKAFLISFVHIVLLGSVLYYFVQAHALYSALIALSSINSMILLYNLSWMMQKLKSKI